MKGLHLDLQPPALDTLRMTCDVFRRAASINSRAAKALVRVRLAISHFDDLPFVKKPVLEMILRKALDAQRSYGGFGGARNQIVISAGASPASTAASSSMTPPNHEKDEMSIIVGRPTVIYSQKDESRSVSSSPHTQNQGIPQTQHTTTTLASTLPIDSLLTQSLASMSNLNEPRSSSAPYTPPSTSYPQLPTSYQASGVSPPSTFACSHSDLTEGWESLFHETSSGPIYQHQMNYHDFQPLTADNHLQPQRQAAHTGYGSVNMAGSQGGHGHHYNLDASYNDRWMAFMNYDVVESFGSGPPRSH